MSLQDDLAQMSAEVAVSGVRVLVIDDEAVFGKAVVRRLTKAGYRCEPATTLAEAGALLETFEPELILLDMRLPDGSGLDFLRALRGESQVPVIVMTAYGEVDDAVTAMKYAASDYLKKPLDLDELLLNVEKVLEQHATTQKLDYSRTREKQHQEQNLLLGESPVMHTVRQQAERMASLIQDNSAPPTVLITGETGTGKDVTARFLHAHSARRERPFVHVDCAALPKELIEAELFGHVKGAFTSAHGERTGLIEAAEDGVVFLDEIGEIPLELQAKLLAVLERRTLRRIGSSQEVPAAAWFIAATNRDVEQMVAAGHLRSDLYFRLNVLTLALPPLRERGEDSVVLAQHFASEVARRYGVAAVSLSAPACTAMQQYDWPGNVRELSHVMERAVLLSGSGEIGVDALALKPGEQVVAESVQGLAMIDEMTIEQMERFMLERAMDHCDHNISEAARRLGLTRMAMRYRLQKYGLREKA